MHNGNSFTRTFAGAMAICLVSSLYATPTEPEEKDFTPEFVAQCTANAEAGDAEGLALYGRALANGWGVFCRVLLTQIDTAIWCRKAAELGFAMAQLVFCVRCDDGVGVEENAVKAAKGVRGGAAQP